MNMRFVLTRFMAKPYLNPPDKQKHTDHADGCDPRIQQGRGQADQQID